MTSPESSHHPQALLCHPGAENEPQNAAWCHMSAQATYAYDLAYHLSGGPEIPASEHQDAHAAALIAVLAASAPSIVAYALQYLDNVLPDLTDDQQEQLDTAMRTLDLRLREVLTGAGENAC